VWGRVCGGMGYSGVWWCGAVWGGSGYYKSGSPLIPPLIFVGHLADELALEVMEVLPFILDDPCLCVYLSLCLCVSVSLQFCVYVSLLFCVSESL
jgi:hypothetical protein